MKYFSMFSGIGGFDLALNQLGHTCIGYSEIDKYAIQTYKKNFGDIKNYGDAKTIKGSELPDFDILTGGFPCQSFSIAGKRRGFNDTRGTLFFDIARVAKAKRPKVLFLENVKGLLNHEKGKTFTVILQTLDELGYDVEWQVLNSKHFGVPQNRERVFIIGRLRGSGRSKVFPIRKDARKVQGVPKEEKIISPCITTENTRRGFGKTEMSQTEAIQKAQISNASKREMKFKDICPTILGRDYKDPKVVKIMDYGKDEGFKEFKQNISPIIRSTGGDYCETPMVQALRNLNRNGRLTHQDGYASSLQTSGNEERNRQQKRLRRLTPTECERLQGFPDNWTEKGKVYICVQLFGNIWNDVQLRNVKESLSTENPNSALNITSDGNVGEILTLSTQVTEGIKETVEYVGVIEKHIVKNGVCDTISLGKDTVMLYKQKETSNYEEITKPNLILERMEEKFTYPLWKITLEENLRKEKLSTILTLIKGTILSQTFTCVKTGKNITSAIIVWKKLEQNFLKKESLNLVMEDTVLISDTQRYKQLGNAVTVNVVKEIAKLI